MSVRIMETMFSKTVASYSRKNNKTNLKFTSTIMSQLVIKLINKSLKSMLCTDLHRKPNSAPQSITCHIRSHNVT